MACTGDDATVCDDDNPCTVDGCNTELGQCENAPVPDGPLEDLQVVGDCQSVTCSAGVETIVDDDSDVFDDGNACTDDICTDGAPENPNRPEGSSCGGSLVCNDNGVCVGCVQPSDCPGSDDFCQAITCNAGQCGVSNTSAGTPLPAGQQTAGECRQRQCDGNGSIQVVNRPASTACNDGIYCNGPDSCLSGNCSQHGPPPCSGGGCNSACNESAQNCTANATNGSPCDDGNPCTTTDSCNGTGTCVGTGNPCAGNVADNDSNCQEACNPATGQCNAAEPAGTACNDGNNCTMTDTCNSSGSCVGTGDPCAGSVGDNDNNCQEACNPATGQCTAAEPTGTACNDGQFCTDTDTCNSSGTCVGTGNPCGTSVCQVCNDSTNTCQNAPNGTPCLGGMDPDPCFVCATGMCMFDPNADPSCLN